MREKNENMRLCGTDPFIVLKTVRLSPINFLFNIVSLTPAIFLIFGMTQKSPKHYSGGDIILFVFLFIFASVFIYFFNSVAPWGTIRHEIDSAGVVRIRSFYGIKFRRFFDRSEVKYLRITEVSRIRVHASVLAIVLADGDSISVDAASELSELKELRERMRVILELPPTALSGC